MRRPSNYRRRWRFEDSLPYYLLMTVLVMFFTGFVVTMVTFLCSVWFGDSIWAARILMLIDPSVSTDPVIRSILK